MCKCGDELAETKNGIGQLPSVVFIAAKWWKCGGCGRRGSGEGCREDDER